MIRQTGGFAERRHLHEVEIHLPGDRERLGQQLDAELVALRIDEADLTGADAVVHPWLVGGGDCGDRASLLSVSGPALGGADDKGNATPTGWTTETRCTRLGRGPRR